MDKNLISIIIATKNGGRFLLRSITSIENQKYKNFEIIIVSDGSTDDTVIIAKKLAKNKKFIKIIELEKNIGPGLARDAGIKASSGKYIALLDDDDEWLNTDKLKNQMDFLDKNIDHVLVGASETDFIKEKQSFIFTYKPKTDDKSIRNKILIKNQFITSSVMFRLDAYEKAGGFAPMYLAEDYDLWLRMCSIGKVANIDNCKIRYYSRPSGAQKSNQKKMNLLLISIIKKNKNKFPNYTIALFAGYLRLLRTFI